MTDEPTPVGDGLERFVARARAKGQPPAELVLHPPDRSAHRAEAERRTTADEWSRSIPPKLAAATLESLEGVAGGSHIIEWATSGAWLDGVNLVLLGATGVGKSWAAIAAASPAVQSGRRCAYWSVPDLVAELDYRMATARDTMRAAQRARLVVLDDLGAEEPNDWTRKKLYELVNYRWNHDLPTIATTNLEPPVLEEAIGQRTYSRLAGGAVAVRLVGPDRRRNG